MAQSNEQMTEQQNEAIALFDGGEWKKDDYDEYGFFFPHRRPTAKEALKYHTSWDWLMPVWFKIQTIGADMGYSFKKFHEAFHAGIDNQSIIKCHSVIYKFIQWYNQQKQTNG